MTEPDDEARERFRRILNTPEDGEAPFGEKPSDLPIDAPLKDGDTAPLRLKPHAPPPFGGKTPPVEPPPSRPTWPAAAPAPRPSTASSNQSSNRPTRPAAAPQPPAPPPPTRPTWPGTSPAPQPPTPPPLTWPATSPAPQPPTPPPPTWPATSPAPTPRPAQRPAPPPAARPPTKRPPSATPPPRKPRAPRRTDWRARFGCLLRTSFIAVFVLLLVALCGVSIMFYQYFAIARTLPDISDIRSHAAQFETMRILDRNGNELYEIMDPQAGKRTYVPLARISPALVAATLATEDKGFYSHPGFDALGIVRAFWQNYTSGEIVSGASTITQQLARSLLLTPEERAERTYSRKLREAILAAEITRRYSKDEILEIYLNEIYYGNLSYGIEAAAETYFGASADKLSLGQAAFLAGLPQAPAIYDVFTNPEAALGRQRSVLRLMFELSLDEGCIYVSNSPAKVCVDALAATTAANEIKEYPFKAPAAQMRYPHWVTYIRSLLEAQFDAQTIYRLGYSVTTTLDPDLQDAAQSFVTEQVSGMAGNNTQSGALVAIKPTTGEILAMVGSADFYNEAISGQVNMSINPRQPGSAIKPLTYLAAFERGWTPATLIWDVPSQFPPSGRADDTRPPYEPQNYDGRFRGPVTVRAALANSLNIPAVKTLQFVGIYDDPARPGEDGLVAFARRMGITTLDKPDYGLSLTLGGGEVTLLQLTGAFATMANSGRRIQPVAISRVVDHSGNVVFEYQPPAGEQVLRPEHAYLITSILSDNRARVPSFGSNTPLELPFPAAVKTGTTNDFRDNWTLGYNPDLAVGVWVGNPDYTQMVNTTGLSGAAPIWNRMMSFAVPKLTQGAPTPFTRPPGIVEQAICDLSGTLPSQWCEKQRPEVFAADQPPLPANQDLWQKAFIDTWTGLRASPACSEFVDEMFVLNVNDDYARKWIRRSPAGQAWAESIGFPAPVRFAPSRECSFQDPRPTLVLAYPQDGQTITDAVISIYAMIDAPQEIEGWRLEVGLGERPVEWETLAKGGQKLPQPDIIATWNVQDFPPGVVTLRLTLAGPDGAIARRTTRLVMLVPTATPMPTATPLPTSVPPTQTPWPTPTYLIPTLPPLPTPTSTTAPYPSP